MDPRTAPLGGNEIPPFEVLDASKTHAFAVPSKRINEGSDVSVFQVSHAYRDILAFVMRLNRSMFPTTDSSASKTITQPVHSFSLDTPLTSISPVVLSLQNLLKDLDTLIEQVPPDPGPRRFGNVSFRTWSQLLEEQCKGLLEKHLPSSVTGFSHEGSVNPLDEVRPYLLGSFGSSQRLDYGTGHELSFLACIGCIWKLGGFGSDPSEDDLRQIVIGLIQPYLTLIRKLILTYTLEPAGSHGVWGLDDHSFLPYVFGSAQYGPAVPLDTPTPTEGSMRNAPDPGKVTSSATVEEQRSKNMYFGAIGFIYDVKTGPFWEHSPTLYDISGVRAGWGKINKGMLKMYAAEVLGKFPVVQHFPFGSLFSFDMDPSAKPAAVTAHTQSQPQARKGPSASHMEPGQRIPPLDGTKAPWATASQATAKPSSSASTGGASSSAPASAAARPAAPGGSTSAMPPPTRAPWAR